MSPRVVSVAPVSRMMPDALSGARFREGHIHVALDVRDRARKLAADQVHLAQLFDAWAKLIDVPVRKDIAKQVTGVDQADQGDVARIGDVVGEQHVASAQLDLALGLLVAPRAKGPDRSPLTPIQGVAPAAEDPGETSILPLHDAVLDELYQRLLADAIRVLGRGAP